MCYNMFEPFFHSVSNIILPFLGLNLRFSLYLRLYNDTIIISNKAGCILQITPNFIHFFILSFPNIYITLPCDDCSLSIQLHLYRLLVIFLSEWGFKPFATFILLQWLRRLEKTVFILELIFSEGF